MFHIFSKATGKRHAEERSTCTTDKILFVIATWEMSRTGDRQVGMLCCQEQTGRIKAG